MALFIENNYSPNFDFKKRTKSSIKFIIIHYTGMKKESDAISRLLDVKSKVSCHYFIKNNGNLIRMVPESYIAWHAGKSKWKKFISLNKHSIGIEISNPGHDHGYKSFNQKQIKSLLSLIKDLKKKFNINKKNILGHSDIAPDRKKDPGEKFSWPFFAKNNIINWHNLDLSKLKRLRKNRVNKKLEQIFIKNLYKIGYCKISNLSEKKSNEILTIAFQRRYRSQLINGKIDQECYLISENVLKTK
ncbi:N-acetylmuramoyl-L-alanine amidase [Candidatus Pelagibacter sp.]|uniref:N-acetylmuramoyl-L-alanine amidase n=1 Tax=Candidatus Pelagibacter sp. TaxID=2024849 RepID=UPI003F84C414